MKTGDAVQFRDAFGHWHYGVATSEIEGTHALVNGHMRKVHDFPVVFVRRLGALSNPVPWPIEDVRKQQGS